MNFLRSSIFLFAAVILLIFGRLPFDIPALRVSFWTDEAWVANSIVSPSFNQLFYPDAWLQTTAPLFLLLVRATMLFAGISETALRFIPYLMSILAVLGFALFARRLLHSSTAILATALFVFTPEVVIHGRQLKQYSAELAAAVLMLLAVQNYLKSRSTIAFFMLVASSLAGLTLGYGLAFLIPAITLMILLPLFSSTAEINSKRKALLHMSGFLLLSAATLSAEYFYFVVPNSSDDLTTYWKSTASIELFPYYLNTHLYPLFQRSLPFLPERLYISAPKHWLYVAPVLIILGCGILALLLRLHNTSFRIFAYITIGLAIVADGFGFYPFVGRTGLYTLPLSVFLLADGVQSFWLLVMRRLPIQNHRLLLQATCLLCSLALGLSFKYPPAGQGTFYFEDYQAAVKYLKGNSGSIDLVFVHGAAAEAYRFYSHQLQWAPYRAYIADSGWPCCARNRDTTSGGNAAKLKSDLEVKLPWPLHGRLWRLYTDRLSHYQYQHFDERPTADDFLKSKGCREARRQTFVQVGLSAWDCP